MTNRLETFLKIFNSFILVIITFVVGYYGDQVTQAVKRGELVDQLIEDLVEIGSRSRRDIALLALNDAIPPPTRCRFVIVGCLSPEEEPFDMVFEVAVLLAQTLQPEEDARVLTAVMRQRQPDDLRLQALVDERLRPRSNVDLAAAMQPTSGEVQVRKEAAVASPFWPSAPGGSASAPDALPNGQLAKGVTNDAGSGQRPAPPSGPLTASPALPESLVSGLPRETSQAPLPGAPDTARKTTEQQKISGAAEVYDLVFAPTQAGAPIARPAALARVERVFIQYETNLEQAERVQAALKALGISVPRLEAVRGIRANDVRYPAAPSLAAAEALTELVADTIGQDFSRPIDLLSAGYTVPAGQFELWLKD